MKKHSITKRTLSILLTLSLLFTTLAYSPRAESEPFDEAAMVDEAISIGIWENFMNSMGLFFEHDPSL